MTEVLIQTPDKQHLSLYEVADHSEAEFGLETNHRQTIRSVIVEPHRVTITVERPPSSKEERRLVKPRVPRSTRGAGSK